VLVTSSHAAIIETIPNALSIHAIKARSPPGTCLRDHFVALYGEGTAEFRQVLCDKMITIIMITSLLTQLGLWASSQGCGTSKHTILLLHDDDDDDDNDST
jgi:hypothetical protein